MVNKLPDSSQCSQKYRFWRRQLYLKICISARFHCNDLKISRNLSYIMENKCLTENCFNSEVLSTLFLGEAKKTWLPTSLNFQLNIIKQSLIFSVLFNLQILLYQTSCVCQILIDLKYIWPKISVFCHSPKLFNLIGTL